MQSVNVRLCHTLGSQGQQGWHVHCAVLHSVILNHTLELNKGHKHSSVIIWNWVALSNLLDLQDLQGSHVQCYSALLSSSAIGLLYFKIYKGHMPPIHTNGPSTQNF